MHFDVVQIDGNEDPTGWHNFYTGQQRAHFSTLKRYHFIELKRKFFETILRARITSENIFPRGTGKFYGEKQ